MPEVDQWLVREILQEALLCEPEQRAEIVAQRAGGDVPLRDAVMRLLHAFDKAGGFLDSAPEADRDATIESPALGGGRPAPHSEAHPRSIGPYRIEKVLGEGGMGVVYLAEQEKPIHRQVALKIIKLGMDTKQVIARFEAEREALALMNHPNVARVFDAGATPQGRPYFAMEFVEGQTITSYCDQHRLSTRERLQLFIQVCQAVQHAHQKGIIHRDLKPSNVLVSQQDNAPAVKVIDFGIAKATQQRLTDVTFFTTEGQMIGTPAYMSPEQAELNSPDIDTRTDIYSLGVMLYELLVGVRPFDDATLRHAGLTEIQRIIRETDPPKPSTRLIALGEASTAISKQRQETRSTLIRQVRGDLDWIVMKCLEKDRTRRYDTANALVMEIHRYLQNEPVLAGPPSAAYRVRKFVRRNRGWVAGAAVLVISLTAGLAGTTLMYFRAVANEAKARTTAEFMSDILKGAGPAVALGRDTTMLREMLDAAAKRIRDGELVGVPEAELKMRDTLGLTLVELGDARAARGVLEPGVKLAEGLFGAPSVELAKIQETLGRAYHIDGQYDEAERMFRAVLTAREQIFGPEDQQVALALSWLGMTIDTKGNFPEAEKLHRQALAMLRGEVGENDLAVALVANRLAVSLINRGDIGGAARLLREALAIQKQSYGIEHPDVYTTQLYLAESLGRMGDYAAATRMLTEETLPSARKLFGPRSPAAARTLFALGTAYQHMEKMPESVHWLREALDLQIELFGPDHPEIATTKIHLASSLIPAGEYKDAERLIREALPVIQKSVGNVHVNVIGALGGLGHAMRYQGNLELAEQVFRESLGLVRKAHGENHPATVAALHGLASTLVMKEEYAEAGQVYEEAMTTAQRGLGGRHKFVAAGLDGLALTAMALGDLERAEQYGRTALAILETGIGGDPLMTNTERANLALTLASQGKYEESEKLARACLENLAPGPGEVNVSRAVAMNALGMVLASRGNYNEAQEALLSSYDVNKDSNNVPPFAKRNLLEQIAKLYDSWEVAEPGNDHAEKAAEYRKQLDGEAQAILEN